MKIGILTFPGSPSHGASLQMYALYNVLKNMEIDIEVINYIPESVNHKNRPPKKIKDKIASVFLENSEKAFENFENKIDVYPSKPLTSTKELKKYTQKYDKIIVGSDQVWNPAVTGNDMNFYLEFCDECWKKAAYAPSFGVDEIEENDKAKVAKLLSDIVYLSVREKRGKEIIKELTGREVPVVLDPTFLINKEEWRKVKKTVGVKGKYVFLYTIKASSGLFRVAKEFSERHGYKFVYISGGLRGVVDKLNPKNYSVFGIGPSELLDLIDGSECVFTNSFHGLALSINLNKNFFVELSTDTNSRLVTLVEKLNLKDQIINPEKFEYEFSGIDYQNVNKILDANRRESLIYLKGIIE